MADLKEKTYVEDMDRSVYDIRDLLNATVQLRDGKKITEMEGLGFKEKLALREVLKKIEGTDIEKLLKEYKVI